MSDFGHVHRITWSVGGKMYTFRSKLEVRWAIWCQFRKEQGLIKNWWYEDQASLLELKTKYMGNRKLYLPDFTILTNDGHYEWEETKGYFTPKDYTKIKLAAQQYDNEITLIFANLTKCKSLRAQYNRARRLEKVIKRVIYDAGKTIFKPISGLMKGI